MAITQTIAVIHSAAEKGEIVLRQLRNAPYRLLVFSKGVTAVPLDVVENIHCPIEASWEADLVILAIADNDIELVAKTIRPVVTQKPVVFITDNNTGITVLSALLPYSRVYPVKANQIESFIQHYH